MTTVLDDSLLDDGDRLLAADHQGALRATASGGARLRSTWAAAADADIASLAGLRPRALVLLGRPGSVEAALRLVASLIVPTSPIPVLVATDAPPWVGALDVVVAAHRGREGDPAEEAMAESVHRAVRRGAQVVLGGPADGPVAAAAAGRALAVVSRLALDTEDGPLGMLDGAGAPAGPVVDADVAGVLAVALRTARELGLIDVDGERLADALDAEAERDGPRGEAFLNPAKSLALRLAEHTPLLWGADAVAGAVAGYGASVLAAHAGVVAHATTLDGAAAAPALQARLTAGGGEDSIFADPFEDPAPAGEPPRLVVVAVREDLLTRRRVGAVAGRSPAPDVLEIDDVELAGETAGADAVRAGVLAARLDFAALYLGLATGAGVTASRSG